MTKNLYVALLLSCSQLAADTFEDRIWKEFQESMAQMNKRFEAIEKYMTELSMPGVQPTQAAITGQVSPTQTKELSQTIVITHKTPTVAMKNESDVVVVTINLGDSADEKINVQQIDIKADGNTLDGEVPVKNGSLTFSIHNGRLFELSLKQEQKKEAKNDQGKTTTQQFASASSTKIESLPDVVADLEKTKVSYKDKERAIELRLPKIAAQKKGTKLNVATN
jgi:hypothetical protein